jgi:small nuclear ribonucleoprotein (snRNP)-like protein
MKATAVVLIVSLFGLAGSAFCQEAGDWQRVAESVPLGSRVKVQTTDGHRISGTLMRVDSTALLVKQNTRYPEPAIQVAFSDVAKNERHKEGGFNVAKAIAIGVASGAGAMLTMIVFAMQLD